MPTPLYLLDSYALIYRAYFAFISRPLRNKHGQNVSALFGYCRVIANLLTSKEPNLIAAVFDAREPTFRHKEYPAYKATRDKAPDDLHSQIPLVERFLSVLGIPILRKEGYEADDIIATLVKKCRQESRVCYIVSGDKDLLQLVGGCIYELRPLKKQVVSGASFISPGTETTDNTEPFSTLRKSPLTGFEVIDTSAVQREWSILPENILDFLALTGDSSDNIPGVKGIGEKTAERLILRYGTLDNIYQNIAGIDGATGKKLNAGKDDAYLAKKLITLCDTVPLPVTEISALHAGTLNYSAAATLLHEYEIRSIAQEFSRLAAEISGQGGGHSPGEPAQRRQDGADEAAAPPHSGPAPEEPAPQNQTGTHGRGSSATPSQHYQQIPAYDETLPPVIIPLTNAAYRPLISIPEIEALFARAQAQGFFALDFETDSLDTATARPVGLSIALCENEAYYIPLAPHGPNADSPFADPSAVRGLLAGLLADSAMCVAAHNSKFDYKVSRAWGLERWNAAIFDTMVAAWLVDPDRDSYALEKVSGHFLGVTSFISYKTIVPKGKPFNTIPLDLACRYSAEDADLCIRLKNKFQNEGGLNAEAGELFYKTEMPLLPILAEMEMHGIQIDTKSLHVYGIELTNELSAIQFDGWSMVGHEFNLASPAQLQDVLFVERSLTPIKKTATGWSTDMSVLKALASQDELCRKILRHRTLSKLKSTYVDALVDSADQRGRLHTTFVQTGTATGRLSSRDPNLQNIPIREEEGRRIRQAFIAGDGNMLVSADYNQIELVVLAHLSGDENLCAAFTAGEDVHSRTAALIFGVEPAAVSSAQRRIAKTINFGVMYGMSAFRLASSLEITRKNALEFIKTYFATYSGVSTYIQGVISGAEQNGYVTTMFGRRRTIRLINSSNKMEKAAAERIAVNTPIQGSAADIVKKAMLNLDAALRAGGEAYAGTKMLLQVHDELVLECPEEKAAVVAELVRDVMENAVTLNIPLRASVNTAKNWSACH
ncbi:MAG: DNA polymerase I [Spirochaetaceae bacterium]|jgi:DNA polymerase-1|nr:DNA polymerase I [Spirochaetaceae bacterium]